ncbi:MAG: CpsD/CapB family tyrosine-protein kinase [Alphaproteobacteria bacterium]|nr:CpsD/CapB family tyrosine-protein kinase [Alphaproteobacteria bacterium]
MDRLERALEKARQKRATLRAVPAQDNARTAILPAPNSLSPDDERRLDAYRIVAHRPRSQKADIYRQLRTKVLHKMNASGFKTLAVTSPYYGDGKTTVTLNLGISLALDLKQTVLLVDLDLRKPCLHRPLNLTPQAGLTDYLLRQKPLVDCLLRPPFERISLLPAGPASEQSSELLASPKMINLAHELKTRYADRFVLYDMPPVLAQDDSIAFLPQVDAILVVIRDGVTKIDDLKRCLNALSGANVIGTVLNNCW